jgi:hypothetical protein
MLMTIFKLCFHIFVTICFVNSRSEKIKQYKSGVGFPKTSSSFIKTISHLNCINFEKKLQKCQIEKGKNEKEEIWTLHFCINTNVKAKNMNRNNEWNFTELNEIAILESI